MTETTAESQDGELGPVRFSSGVENDRAGARWDNRTKLARRNLNRKVYFPCSADHK